MPHNSRVWGIGLAVLIAIGALSFAIRSQTAAQDNSEGGEPKAEERVVIQREALRLIDPGSYQVPLKLEPVRRVHLAAPIGGVVQSVSREPGDEVLAQTEVVHLDDTEQGLLLKRAEANQRVAEIELRRARKQTDPDLMELAEARKQAADAEVELAKHRLTQTQIRAPFDGQVFRSNVIVGQVVRAAEPLIEFGDASQLRVEIPAERGNAKVGGSIEVTIEGAAVTGTVEHVLPPAEEFEPLRELVHSIASAVVLIDNEQGRYHPGQTVTVSVVPKQYVSQIPNGSLGNVPEGGRKVQVVRSGVVRDVPVRLLGAPGDGLSYVTGPFAPGDELIVSASRELLDGTQVRPVGVAASPAEATGSSSTGSTTRKPTF